MRRAKVNTDIGVNVNTPAIKGAKNDNATVMKVGLRSGAAVTPDTANLETKNLTPRQRVRAMIYVAWTLH